MFSLLIIILSLIYSQIIDIDWNEQTTTNQFDYILTLDPLNLQYYDQINLDMAYLRGYGYEYGIWTSYIPLSSVISLGNINNFDTNCSLIHYITDSSPFEQFVYYICMIYESLSIVHTVEFINQQGLQKVQLIIPNSFKYEGTWIYFHLSCIPLDNFSMIYLSTYDQTYQYQQNYYESNPFSTNQLNFHYGNSKRLINRRFSHIPPLSSFRGQIVLYLFQIPVQIRNMHINDRSITIFLDTVSSYFFKSCWEYIDTFSGTISESQLIQVVDPISTLMDSSYLIKGWFKQEGKLEVGKKYQFIDIFPAISLFGYDELLNIARFKLNYYKPTINIYQFLIETYSFQIPNINIDPRTIYYQDIIQINQSFSEWHYITIKLYQSTIEIIISMKETYFKDIQVKQYSRYDIEVSLANGFLKQNIQLLVQQFQFSLCESNILTIDLSPQCSSICRTCSGPNSNNCESCNTDGCQNCTINKCPQYCRLLIPEQKQCVCHFGFFDMNGKCYGIENTGFILEGTNQVIQYNSCKIGYFKYNDQCFKCPEIMNLYIRSCIECQGNGDQWIYNSYCVLYFQSYNEDSNQSYQGDRLDQSHLYLFQYDELYLCEFCTYFDTWTSNPLPIYQHLDQYIAVYCQLNYDIVNGRCIKVRQIQQVYPSYSTCHSTCYQCTSTYCTSCYDQISTYLNLFEPQQCLPCVIENCKYCFDYSVSNPQINSFQSYTIEINYDDIITGCSLCFGGYTYNFQTRQCETIQIENNCRQGIISQTNQKICIVSEDINSAAYQFLNCEGLIENCSECTIINGIATCAICSIGYRYNLSQNKCNPCSSETQDYYFQCAYEIQPPYKNIDFVGEIQGFYYYLTNNLLAIHQNTLYTYGIECILGLYNFNGMCMSNTVTSCSLPYFNLKSQYVRCLKCEPSIAGVQIKGTQSSVGFGTNSVCESCVYYCKYCLYDDQLFVRMNNKYNGWNAPNKCAISQDNKYIDLDYGRVKAYPYITLYNKQYLACQNITQYYASISPDWNPLFWRLKFLDQLSFDRYIIENTIIDNIDKQCITVNYMISDAINNYWLSIFTIKEYLLIFKSQDNQQNTLCLLQLNAQFSNKIEFHNLEIDIVNDYNHTYSQQVVSILQENIYFKGISQQFLFNFYIYNYNLLNLTNVVFKSLILNNNSIFKFQITQTIDNSHIIIDNVTFLNCNFTLTNFMIIQSNSINTNLQIKSLIFQSIYFTQSQFIEILDQINYFKISIDQLIISNCTFNSTYVFSFPIYSNVVLSNIQITNSILENSNLIKFLNGIEIKSVDINNLILLNSTLFTSNTVISADQLSFTFTNFNINQVQIENSKIINLQMKDDCDLTIKLTNISHFQLLDKSSQSIAIYNFLRFSYSQNAVTFNSLIIIQNILFNSIETNLQYKLPLWSTCINTQGIPPILEINKFENIIIEGFVIKNQIFKDIIGININLESNINYEKIILKNITFDTNLLIHQNGGQELKFIQIYSKLPIPIYLNSFKFYNNMVHAYQNEMSQIQESFIIINSYQSQVIINDFDVVNNYFSNKSSSMFYIDCQNISIYSFQSNQNNQKINYKLIQQFTETIQSLIVNQIIGQAFQVQTTTGLGTINFMNLLIQDSKFQNSFSQSINLFKLIGKDSCNIIMTNIFIVNQSSTLESLPSKYGCLYIDSSSSILSLKLSNITIFNILSRISSAFLYILPSQIQNQITLTNFSIYNIFSLKHGLLYLDLQQSYSIQNKLVLSNITIINEFFYFQSYLSSLIYITQTELQQLQTKTGLLYVSYSQIQLNNIRIQGYYISPLFEFESSQHIEFTNINLKYIEATSVLIKLTLQYNYKLIFNNFNVYFINQLYQNTQINSPNTITLFELTRDSNCQLRIRQNLDNVYQSNLKEKINYKLIISQLSITFIGFFEIQTNYNQIYFQNIKLKNIQCSQCTFGAIYFLSSNYSQILMRQVTIENGQYQYHGHLSIIGDNTNLVVIKNSQFISSECIEGCGNYFSSSKITINETKYINNSAVIHGGGIQYQNCDMKFYQTQFVNNSARLGSAIYLENNKLDTESLNQIYLSNNSNVVIKEIPSSLNCYYQGQLLQKQSKNYDFQLIELSKQIVHLPSAIPLNEYKIFNEFYQTYQNENFSLYFIALNQRQEGQQNLSGSYCNISQNVINLTNSKVLKKQTDSIMIFDENLNFYSLSQILHDPYSNQNEALQLQVICNQIDSYIYKLNIKTLYCQMGEYYSNEGCYKCDYTKGYYSVKQNCTKCSQIDINKVINNTANMLNLKQGYWRNNIHQEQIEQCELNYCLGGWKVGVESCQIGYIGALCQECDLYQLYTRTSSNQCLPCQESWSSIISLVLLSLWTLFSIQLTVRSVQFANEQFRQLVLTNRQYSIISKFNQDVAGCLIKMLTNQLLIISVVYSFQNGIVINLSWIGAISSPSLTNAFNFDCWLVQQSYIDILYLRLFLILILPFVYLNCFIWCYLLWIIIKKQIYDISTLLIAITYIFIVTQPDIIKYAGSLIASITISQIRWVQQNISYHYDTQIHQQWILYFAFPILILWCVIIPLYYGWSLYQRRKQLEFSKIRRKLSYLYQEYQLKCYYWEIIKIIQRELQVLVLTVYQEDILLNVCLLFFIQFLYLTTVTKLQPFNMDELNKLEISSVQKCILILILGLIAHFNNNNQTNYIQIISQTFLILTTILHILPFIIKLLLVYLEKYKRTLFEIAKRYQLLNQLFGIQIQNLERKDRVQRRFKLLLSKIKNRLLTIKKIESGMYNQIDQSIINQQPNPILLLSARSTQNKRLLEN